MRRNHLLSKPPRAEHRLRDTRAFRRAIGRAPRQSDYDGVHTASESIVAAAYAISAWRAWTESRRWSAYIKAVYPVLVMINVDGLEPLPDVDAMLRGAEAVQDLLPQYRQMTKDGQTFYDMLNEEDFQELEEGIGDDPIGFVFEDVGTKLLPAIESYAAQHEQDPEHLFASILKNGELPDAVLTQLVGQQRYLTDIGLDRIVKVEAIRPWWRRVEGDYDDPETEEAQALGYYVFTLSDWPFVDAGETKVLYKNPSIVQPEIEYHGTTSFAIEAAFPGLVPEETPFPLKEE